MELQISENLDVAVVHITSQTDTINRSAVLLYLLCESISKNNHNVRLIVGTGANIEDEFTMIQNVNSIVKFCENKFSDISIDTRFYRFMKPEAEIRNDPQKILQYRIEASKAFMEEALREEDDSLNIAVYSSASLFKNSKNYFTLSNYDIQQHCPFINMSNDEVLALCPDILV